LRTYPNPSNDIIIFDLPKPGNLSDPITADFWIVKANYANTLPTEYQIGENNLTYTSKLLDSTINSHLVVDVSSYEEGYYRIYFEMCENLLWNDFLVKHDN